MTDATAPPPDDVAAAPASLTTYLERMREAQASDLFLGAGVAPALRVHGQIVRSGLPHPTDDDMRRYVDEVLTPVARARFDESPDVDFALHLPDAGRFRINVFLHQGRLGLVARPIPDGAVEFDALGLPDTLRTMADANAGLVLIVGPTGCGKSTTLAAMVHHVNRTRPAHVVTIEDPIEFVHTERRALIHQRQVGYDTVSFATALRHVVRQSPDVILIGEMRDPDTVQTALSAALTGHLVLSTLHTSSVVQAVDRMLGYFEPGARAQAQADLASTLVGIAAMRLVPTADGQGRAPAVEVLVGTPTARRLVAEGAFVELFDLMKRSRDAGMCTMTQALVDLCNGGAVDAALAERFAPNPEEFRLNMDGMYTGIASIDLRTEPDGEDDGWIR